jgi:hypothetical protein
VPGERGVHSHADTSPDRRPDRGDAQRVRQTARAALFLVQMTDERPKCTKTHRADDGARHGAILETVARPALRRLSNADERFRSERPASNLDDTRPHRCGRSRLEPGPCTVLRSHGARAGQTRDQREYGRSSTQPGCLDRGSRRPRQADHVSPRPG